MGHGAGGVRDEDAHNAFFRKNDVRKNDSRKTSGRKPTNGSGKKSKSKSGIGDGKMNHERHEKHEPVLFKNECYQIQGAIFEVYREMGCGFLESVYQECLGKELARRGIPFVAQKELVLSYKGEVLAQRYVPDILCNDMCRIFFVTIRLF